MTLLVAVSSELLPYCDKEEVKNTDLMHHNCFRHYSHIPQRHPYFDVVVGLARSYDPESYAGSSLILVGSPMPGRSKVMTETNRDALALHVWGR
jgi:hypothetical protein